ncbi:MAG TPA: hypothetical protein DEG96_07750 [Candidatus Atribacteria bacterium]|nr:hypothetical protein [Candidatus Atribacteria bacterium]
MAKIKILNLEAIKNILKTHKIGGKLFKIAGVIALLGVFFQNYAFFFIIIPVIAVSAYTIIYSYVEYQREMK